MKRTTVAVSREVYEKLLEEKRRLGARTLGETIDIIIREYRKMKRLLAIYEIIEKNESDRKVTCEELLEDRRKWGKSREFS